MQPRLAKVDRLVRHLPLGKLQLLTPRALVTLVYHVVSRRSLPYVEHLYSYKSPDAFERDLIYVKERLSPVGHEDIVAHMEGRRSLPPNAVAVTFDDGFAECFSVVRPLLLKYGIPCTFFIVTNLIDNRMLMFRNKISLCLGRLKQLSEDETPSILKSFKDNLGLEVASPEAAQRWTATLEFPQTRKIDSICEILNLDVDGLLRNQRPYMKTDEILQLHNDGFTIGAHTCNHPRLCLFENWEDARQELVSSCVAIRSLTGQSMVPIAFPFNGIRLSRDALARLRQEEGFISLMYDTNNLMKDRDFIVNRVWCDTTLGVTSEQSNLELLIKRAHALEAFRVLKRWRAARKGWGGEGSQ